MKLIGDIINELVDTTLSLQGPLLKTKVLATKIKHQELLSWVEKQINGYKDLSELPEYRVHFGAVTGNYILGNLQYVNQPLPTRGLKKTERIFRIMEFSGGISSLESLTRDPLVDKVEVTIPAELAYMLQSSIQRMGNPYFNIVSVKKWISISVVTQILSTIRSNLLDFMLKVDDEFGSITEIEDLRNKNAQITTIMYQTINNNGDGNVTNTGSHAIVTTTINITKGDKDALRGKLKEAGLADADVTELTEVIDLEPYDSSNETFGPKVNSWVSKMIAKTLDGSWQIATGAAGGLLVELIKAYYGM